MFASLLDVGFNPPRCPNAYTIPGGREMIKIVQEEEETANKRIADMVFGNLDDPVLSDSSKAIFTKGQGRQAQDIQWCEEQQKIVEICY
ncbi:uncharacterized protein ARMOST_06809 [Armillaria ostoyae]|uniref:Uncharacterized protein n=1 Tax=Armillaria ostoyae TaxID=47428 RepID=A0A284R414_ARMOS|nr:uncharacterized protein ARMOST_06809 [Armillaria ostoyae]